jgi:hypothetical protein
VTNSPAEPLNQNFPSIGGGFGVVLAGDSRGCWGFAFYVYEIVRVRGQRHALSLVPRIQSGAQVCINLAQRKLDPGPNPGKEIEQHDLF